jgi:hypothetical protein
MSWRTVSFVLATACSVLLWRDCTRTSPPAAPAAASSSPRAASHSHETFTDDREPPPAPPPAGGGIAFYGFQVPGWAVALAPQPGEDMLAYRDRVLPIAQAAVAPQRARVARSRDDFAAIAGLDTHQRQVLDAAAQEAATAIEERVLGAALSGDFNPATFKPMTGVEAARDVLDSITRADQKFRASLDDRQRALLAQHPFDFADYLLFSTRWEDVLGLTN